MSYERPDAKWFVGRTTNLCYNCVDKHVAEASAMRSRLVWEGEPVEQDGPETKTYTYAELQSEIASLPMSCAGSRSTRAMLSRSTWG